MSPQERLEAEDSKSTSLKSSEEAPADVVVVDEGESECTPSTLSQPMAKSTPAPSKRKKRNRVASTSSAVPGKAIPMAEAREKEVAKRFVELEVSEVYKAIRKQTGALGGNAAGGAIYGEITQSSFQRVIDFLKDNCELDESSLFLDVGSGLGKPNLHTAVDPGVEVSYGLELEELRWQLSLVNLKSVLAVEACKHRPMRVVFTSGDISDAQTLEPFTHIYSFDVGFPPFVMHKLAKIFNKSTANYFTSFHSPRKFIDNYGFDVKSIGRVHTSMAGSSEGHTCYFYQRVEMKPRPESLLHVDPLFRPGFDVVSQGRERLYAWIQSQGGDDNKERATRTRTRRLKAVKRKQERPLESFYKVIGKSHVMEDDALTKKRRTSLVSA